MIVKLGFSPEQFFDDEGIPLAAGRITLTAHGSDIPIPVFYRQSDSYVQAPNPIITAGDGRIETVFFDATVIDVRIEKRLEDGSYEPLDTYQYGMDVPSETDSNRVIGINALKDVDPSVGIVTVVGYNDATDAPERMYIWDSHCTALADDGTVVESNSGSAGRWLLVWNDEKLPCSVYGIKPGVDESNINAFLNYQLVVGTYSIHMPPIPRFFKGTYSTTSSIATGKTLYFDVGAKFNAHIACKSAIIEPGSDYVADFTFTKQDVAMAEWFKTARRFLTCHANVLRYGALDHFADASITNPVSITGTTIEGSRRLNLTYSSGAYISLTDCTVTGRGLFDPSVDCLKFVNSVWNQEWFTTTAKASYDFGLVTQGARFEYNEADGDDISLDLFPNTDIYLKMRAANELNKSAYDRDRTLYLENRTVTGLEFTDLFNEIHDVTVKGFIRLTSQHLTAGGVTLELHNVNCITHYSKLDAASVALFDCRLVLDTDSAIASLMTFGSDISSGNYPWTSNTNMSINGGNWSVPIVVNDDDTTSCNAVEFNGVNITASAFTHKNLSLKNCVVTGTAIKVYPSGAGVSYTSKFTAIGNIFDITDPIRFDKHDTDDEADTVHDVVPVLVMMDNKFVHQGRGMWMRYWSSITNKTFFFAQSSSETAFNLLGGKLLYLNNTGYCPQDSFEGEYSSWVEKSVFYPEQSGGEDLSVYVANTMVYCVPKYFSSPLYFYASNANRKTFWAVSTNASIGNLLTWEGRGSYIRYAQLGQGIINIGDNLHGDDNDALMYASCLPYASTLNVINGFQA